MVQENLEPTGTYDGYVGVAKSLILLKIMEIIQIVWGN